jgi:hypothetical protein
MLGVPIEAAIPVVYLAAITLHFNLQRRFVFRHVSTFALDRRRQITRYAAMASIQYPTTAIATSVLPGLLHVSERTAYVITVLAISATFFLALRREHLPSRRRLARPTNIRTRHPQINAIVGDCQQRLEFDDGYFDRILPTHVLEHLPNLRGWCARDGVKALRPARGRRRASASRTASAAG